jgi:hypothetical protein
MGLGNVRYARLQRTRLSSHPGQLLVPLCLNGSIMAPFSHPVHRTGEEISCIRLSDKTSRFRVQRHRRLNIYWS